MLKQLYLLVLFLSQVATSQAQANWYTPEVRKELGQEISANTSAIPPPFPTAEYKLKNCRVVAATVASFDTIATYAQGRLVDATSHKPIKAALIQASYTCFGEESRCETRTAITDSRGFFRLGWVGCSGPSGGRSNRPLKITAVGYPAISTAQVNFGGAAYLHIELAAATGK
jgi:hypothetical protein